MQIFPLFSSQLNLPPTPPSSTSSADEGGSTSPTPTVSSNNDSPTAGTGGRQTHIRVHPTLTANTLAAQLLSSSQVRFIYIHVYIGECWQQSGGQNFCSIYVEPLPIQESLRMNGLITTLGNVELGSSGFQREHNFMPDKPLFACRTKTGKTSNFPEIKQKQYNLGTK